MLVDKVVARTSVVATRIHIGVVAIDKHVRVGILERMRKQISRPIDPILSCPCLLRIAVESMDENDVDLGLRVRVHGRELVPGNMLINRALLEVNSDTWIVLEPFRRRSNMGDEASHCENVDWEHA